MIWEELLTCTCCGVQFDEPSDGREDFVCLFCERDNAKWDDADLENDEAWVREHFNE